MNLTVRNLNILFTCLLIYSNFFLSLACKQNQLQRNLAIFDENVPDWLDAVACIAQLDCLLSLAKTSAFSLGLFNFSFFVEHLLFFSFILGNMCRPQFISSEESLLEVKELWHPCINMGHDFIPNTLHLGNGDPRLVLLTGKDKAF